MKPYSLAMFTGRLLSYGPAITPGNADAKIAKRICVNVVFHKFKRKDIYCCRLSQYNLLSVS